MEKVYLHFDNTAYFRGETIWFAATVVDAATGLASASKVLYVELLSPTGVVLKQQKLRIKDGRCHGSFPLVDSDVDRAVELRGAVPYPSGYYEVRAYTRAMLGYDDSYFFSRVFPVYQSPEEEGDYARPLLASYPGREPDRPDSGRTLPQGKLNVSFYPEGGNILIGTSCRVAFRVSDNHCIGVDVDSVCDIYGVRIDIGRPHRGMGVFEYLPDSGRDMVKIYAGDQSLVCALPKAESLGSSIRYERVGKNLQFSIFSQGSMKSVSNGYTLASGGKVWYKGNLCAEGTNDGCIVDTTLLLPVQSLPTGVAQFALYDVEGRIVARRLLFVDNGIPCHPVVVTSEAINPKPFAPVTLCLHTPEPATFSLAVRDVADYGTKSRDDIRSYMLLSSELKGFIEDPDWYFGEAPDPERMAALDLLMMVQGWTRYENPEPACSDGDEKWMQPEQGLMIDGWTFNRITERPVGDTKVYIKLFSPDFKYKQQAWTTSDSNGYWQIHLADFTGNWILYLYTQQKSRNPEKVTTRLRLGRCIKPKVKAYQPEEMFIPGYAGNDEDLDVYRDEREEPFFKVLPDVVDIAGDSYLLEEVEIEGKRRYIDYNRFHAFNAGRDTEEILDAGRYTGDILSFLERKGYSCSVDYPVIGESMNSDYMLKSATKVSIDGHLTYWTVPMGESPLHRRDDMLGTPANSLWATDMSDVKDIVVYDYEPGHRYVEVEVTFLQENERNAKVKNVRQTTFAGYSQPVEFYAPTYPDGPVPGDKDYRRTVYWNPEVTTDSTGCATVSFYNNGYSRSLTVSAEGLTKNGVPILNK